MSKMPAVERINLNNYPQKYKMSKLEKYELPKNTYRK